MEDRTLQGYRLSPQQAQLWRLQQSGDARPYYTQCVVQLQGAADAKLIERAIGDAIERQEIMRTTFHTLPGMDVPLQVVVDRDRAWRHDSRERGAIEIDRALEDLRNETIDFEKGPLLHTRLLTTDTKTNVLLISVPSLCTDSVGLVNFVSEIARCYGARVGNDVVSDQPVHYIDVCEILNDGLESKEGRAGRNYWLSQEVTNDRELRLPFAFEPEAKQRFTPDSWWWQFDTDTTVALEAFACAHHVAVSMVLFAAWNVLLSRLTRQTDFTAGFVHPGRTCAELLPVVGLFAKHVPVRCAVAANQSFAELLLALHQRVEEQQRWLDYFTSQTAGGEENRQGSPFSFEFKEAPSRFRVADLDWSIVAEESFVDQFEIKLVCTAGNGVTARFHYDAGRFAREDVSALAEQYETLLREAMAQPNVAVSQLKLTSAAERKRVCEEFNATAVDYERDVTLHGMFERAAVANSDAVAVSSEAEQLSYRALNARANQLAHWLRQQGLSAEQSVGAEQIVGVALERSLVQVTALLAILKAGAAYLPLAVSDSAERQALLVRDAGAQVVLTAGGASELQRALGSAVRVVDLSRAANEIAAQSEANVEAAVTEENLAYVIYTSGSSGRPKGVMITHAGICNRLQWMAREYEWDAEMRVLQKTAAVFDASVWELFAPLWAGGRLVLAGEGEQADSEALLRLVQQHEITTLQLVPTMLAVVAAVATARQCRSLRQVFAGGERLTAKVAEQAVGSWPQAELTNLYGPTETSIDASYWRWRAAEVQGAVPIGRPLANMRVYVAGERGESCGYWEAGEVTVAGRGLARGYVGRAELTAERFVPDALSESGGERVYRTGDVGRWRRTGMLEYLGRADGQVKVRGCRIEVEEVEARLREHPWVGQAAVKLQPETSTLIAYVVARAGQSEWYRLPNDLEVSQLNTNETGVLYEEIFVQESYLQQGIRLQPGDCVFDVGANIGLFTLWVYERCGVARVFAFEPLPQTFAQLERNVRAYSLPVELYQCGLGAAVGEWQFTYYPKATAMSGRYAEAGEDERLARALLKNQDAALNEYANELMAQRFASEQVRCEVTTISAVLAQHGVEQIDLLKVDVEKSELDVLAGIAAHDWPRIKQVVVEVHDKQGRLAAIRELLERQGFAVAVQQDELLGGTELYNVYAVHPSRDERRPQSSETTDWRPSRMVTAEQKLRRYLQRYLPAYMLPSQIVVLDQLPLLPSGKLNRQALPDPASLTATLHHHYVAPRTPMEKQLASIWAELLEVDQVGLHDNFFEIGGHSLLATELMSRLREQLQIDLPLKVLFNGAQTVEALAAEMDRYLIESADTTNIVEALKEIDDLSEDELNALLEIEATLDQTLVDTPQPQLGAYQESRS